MATLVKCALGFKPVRVARFIICSQWIPWFISGERPADLLAASILLYIDLLFDI